MDIFRSAQTVKAKRKNEFYSLLLAIAGAISILPFWNLHALADTQQPHGCPAEPASENVATEGPTSYENGVAELLRQARFAELDCIADSAREKKERSPGGRWKLEFIYAAIEEPRVGHATEVDWHDHLEQLEKWVQARPESITARVALAEAYINYAWDARGNGTSDTVSNSGWGLFEERLEKARQILQEADSVNAKCPEWFIAMHDVAIGQGWDGAQEQSLFERALAFDPSFYYFYRMRAVFLLPKWYGQDGQSSDFARQSADSIGGTKGDVLYFQIASKLVCACDEPEFSRMSWPRIQRGFDALEKQYGPSVTNLNLMALMAVKNGDAVAADAAFKRIGERWDKQIWITETFFNDNKAGAEQAAAAQVRFRAVKAEAEANLHTAGGAAYKKAFDEKFSLFMRKCIQTDANDHEKFELLVQVSKEGGTGNLWAPRLTPVARCVFEELTQLRAGNQTPFPVPPKPSYWIELELDPATFVVAAR